MRHHRVTCVIHAQRDDHARPPSFLIHASAKNIFLIAMEYGQSILRPKHIRGKQGHRLGVKREHVLSACRPRAYASMDTRACAILRYELDATA
jgi:hypothetical protein